MEHQAPGRCPTCQAEGPFTELPPDISDEIEYLTERLIRLRHRMEKKKCSCGAIFSAPAPIRVTEGGLYGPRLHANAVVSKCADALPLHRISRRLARAGMDIARECPQPTLNWVFAETGLGWVSSVLEACDAEWEKRHLWSEGILSRPSDLFRRQIYVDFWFETVGIQLRDYIGVDNILWESDFPHITSTYPNSWDAVEHSLAGVSAADREKILFRNAARLYRL